MKLRIDRSHMSQPDGGWGIVLEDGPVLSDEKVDGLIKKMKDHRVVNGLPVGDPENEIAMKYASAFPWLIKQVPDEEEEANDAESWIHRLWRSFPMQMAETRARDERFEQCVKCPHFEPLEQDSLSGEALRRLILMNPAKSRTEHGWCLLRGWIPSIAVQIHDPWNFADWTIKDKDCWLDQAKPITK